MTEAEIRARLTDRQALALTMYAEAVGDIREGGSSVEERIAVGCVIRNRVREPTKYGDSYTAVCLARRQFSAWNPGRDANHRRLIHLAYLAVTGQPLLSALAEECFYLADGILLGVLLDRVGGATHYYAPKAMQPAGRVPTWAKGQAPVARVGDQIFYRL